MPDREKTLKGLEHCANEQDCRGCPYFSQLFFEQVDGEFTGYKCKCLADVLALLKEQPDVVRCKDCRCGDWSRNGKGEKMILCYNGDTGIEDGYLHEPDWFCAEGKRKKGG